MPFWPQTVPPTVPSDGAADIVGAVVHLALGRWRG